MVAELLEGRHHGSTGLIMIPYESCDMTYMHDVHILFST